MVACHMSTMLAFAVLAFASSLDPDSLCSRGACLAEESESMQLLQVESSKKPKKVGQELAQEAQSQERPAKSTEAQPARSVEALQVQEAAQLNATGEAPTCEKSTGGACLLSGICDDSRSAMCQAGMCVCPEYTCASEGKCSISPYEIKRNAGGKANSMVASITESAAKIPGLADSAGVVQGAWNTASGVAGAIFGTSGCSAYVGLCWGQCSNQEVLGYTAKCTYGSCQCVSGFCAKDGKCEFDVSGALTGAAQSITR